MRTGAREMIMMDAGANGAAARRTCRNCRPTVNA
jgi:hypothetical protein